MARPLWDRSGVQAEAQPQPRGERGAFVDVDGTLVSTNVAHAYAYYVFNRGTVLGALGRIVKGLAMAPLYKAADLYNRKVFNELFYRAYRGLSEDRLIELAGGLCEDVLAPAVYPGAMDIIAEARRGGCKIVLCTGAIRSEEHTSELQSRQYLVCRLLLEKKKK